jgi:3-hydroxyacyl-[acyl-carrier-protein] dehydratase
MRWFWIDRYTEFVAGQHATAIKNVSLAEDHLHDHFPGAPVMPNSLVLEGMAQTAGLLVAQNSEFEREVVLAKVAKAEFHFLARPGDTLVYRAKIEDFKEGGAFTVITSHVGDRLQGEAEIFFAHLDRGASAPRMFEPEAIHAWLQSLRMFEVARDAAGNPLSNAKLLAACHAASHQNGANSRS